MKKNHSDRRPSHRPPACGHYVGSLKERVRLQNSGEYDEIYVMIADAQALTDNADNPEKVRQNVLQVALDYLPWASTRQGTHLHPVHGAGADRAELLLYEPRHRPPRLAAQPHRQGRNPSRTNFESSIPGGFFTYPISQAADITAFKALPSPQVRTSAP